jgi:cyclic pyranopterin phosphate synthase
MLDRFNRKINYLRISVTDRCNLRCRYCMPEEGVCLLRHEDILSYEEIREVVSVAVPLGIDKIRLTGGEPLVRKDIVELVAMIASVQGVRDMAMTTNGILLERYAESLAKAGLHRVNVSLDTVDEEKFRQVTRGGDIRRVFSGIEAARRAGLSPIKINCVVGGEHREEEAMAVRQYCLDHGLEGRFIPQMDLGSGDFGIVEGGSGGDCVHCNRLRLTSNGRMKPCLFSGLEYDIRELGIRRAIELALGAKPEKGTLNQGGCFHQIGG